MTAPQQPAEIAGLAMVLAATTETPREDLARMLQSALSALTRVDELCRAETARAGEAERRLRVAEGLLERARPAVLHAVSVNSAFSKPWRALLDQIDEFSRHAARLAGTVSGETAS